MPEEAFRFATEGGRTPIGATPPEWMKDAWCAPEWPHPDGRLHASPWDQDKTSDEKAAELCADCPVIAECLASAMAEEGSLTARNRYGVRGGLGPEGRARLALQERVCNSGHSGEWVWQEVAPPGRSHWRCQGCQREKSRQRYTMNPEDRLEYQRQYRAKRRVKCPECDQEMHQQSLPKHIERKHTEAGQRRGNQRAGRAA